MVLALILTSTLAATPAEALAAAKAHLAADKLDDVLFALEGQKFDGPLKAQAAGLYAQAAKRSLAQKDAVMAIQFAESAVKQVDDTPLAHEVLAKAYKEQQQFGPAEHHAERWIDSTQAADGKLEAVIAEVARARLFRAQLALEQGDWGLAQGLADGLAGAPLTGEDKQLVELIRKTARKEQKDRSSALSGAKELEKKMEQALVDAKRLEARGGLSGGGAAAAMVNTSEVVVYGTTWCGYCKQAQQYLRSKNIPFRYRDIEKDPGAREELAIKAQRQGVKPTGVPVVDVKGKLLLGWNPQRFNALY